MSERNITRLLGTRCKQYVSQVPRAVAAVVALICMSGAAIELEECADGSSHVVGYCPADLSSPGTSGVTASAANGTVVVNRSDGTLYGCVTTSDTLLSAAEIIACSGGAAVDGDSESVDSSGTRTLGFSGLGASTGHYAQFVHVNDSGWASNRVVSSQFTTDASGGSALFTETFNYSDMTIGGSCRSEGDADCDSATFPLDDTYHESSSFDPGWTFLVHSTNAAGNTAQGFINDEAGRSGKGFAMWDDAEPDRGPSQWGSEVQMLKILPEEHPELWVRFYARIHEGNPLSNQKMIHFFHYDRDWFEAPTSASATNTSESTDGGFICNWRAVNSTEVEIRCSIRHANPPEYSPTSGQATVSVDGTVYNFSNLYRFDLRTGGSCTTPADSGVANFWATDTWYKIEMGAKLNSAIGVADGWMEVWFEDCKLGTITGIPFKQSGATEDHDGFNGIAIGGNAQNHDWGSDGDEFHTWDIDDVQFCTERCE